MCGIVGYVGPREAGPLLMEGLKRLEYRGYDSAGIATLSNGGFAIHRSPGKLGNLAEKLAGAPAAGATGIGHTRWATHGRPTEMNAHPQTDAPGRSSSCTTASSRTSREREAALAKAGHRFKSETDTEVFAHLVEAALRRRPPRRRPRGGPPADRRLRRGRVLAAGEPGVLVTARRARRSRWASATARTSSPPTVRPGRPGRAT